MLESRAGETENDAWQRIKGRLASGEVFSLPVEQAWQKIFDYLWETFSLPIQTDVVDAITTERDKSIKQPVNILSGSTWELWQQFEQSTPLTSRHIKQF